MNEVLAPVTFAEADASLALSHMRDNHQDILPHVPAEDFLGKQNAHLQELSTLTFFADTQAYAEPAAKESDTEQTIEDFGTRNYRPFNRGNKLKRTIEQTANVSSRPSLWKVHSIDEDTEFGHIGKRRAILRKPGARSRFDDQVENNDAYAGISVEELWAHADRPTDIKRIRSATYTLRNRQLKLLSDSAMSMIEREKDFNKRIVRFSQLIQQDDPLAQDVDFEKSVPANVLKDVREGVQELVSCSNEFVNRIGELRSKLLKVYAQKKNLARRLVPFRDDEMDEIDH
ncbi:hypothetical protein HDV00_003300 [Rhizophlyctis rosea]|nr:hypothetical protein HDV00_003300 [Rhizophlyctis rosea]